MTNVTGTFAVIQLNRLGDLIQSHQTVKDLKRQHPNVVVKLIAREEFYKPLSFLLKEAFDDIILIKRDDLLRQAGDNLQEFIDGINKLLAEPRLQNIDVIINQSFCQSSNYLTTLIPAKHRLGTHINSFNQVVVSDQWSQLVYSMVMGGPNCPFHLVDIFKNQFGIKERKIWDDAQRHVGEDQTLALQILEASKVVRGAL